MNKNRSKPAHVEVSVVIPCCNQSQFLGKAIESVLSQCTHNLEVIVINDGSTDNTEDVALQYPQIRYIVQENQGPSASRNRGYHVSKGNFIVFLDSDDMLGPNAIKAGLESLEEAPEAAFTFGAMQAIDVNGTFLHLRESHRTDTPYKDLLANNFIPTPGMVMFRRSTLDKYGLFDSEVNFSEDYELYLRITRNESIAAHNEISVFRRFHSHQATCNPGLMLHGVLKTHHRQKRYAYSNQSLRIAYDEGRKFWKNLYGEQVLTVMRIYAHQKRSLKFLENVILLFRFYPLGLWRFMIQPIRSNRLWFEMSDEADEAASFHIRETGTKTMSRYPNERRIISITVETFCPEGSQLQLRRNIITASVQCSHVNKCAVLFLNKVPIDTMWKNHGCLIAYFPKDRLKSCEANEIYYVS